MIEGDTNIFCATIAEKAYILSSVTWLTFCPDTIILHIPEGKPVLQIDDHEDSVTCAEFNSKGTLLATGDMKGLVVISSVHDLTKRYRVISRFIIMFTI